MAEVEKSDDHVGVRELRQNLSIYLDRVKQGETLRVTERGREVAKLMPSRRESDWLDELIASGKATPAKGSLVEWLRDRQPLPPAGPGEPTLSEILQELREERLP